ncbi:hypothetical protein AAFF_G00007950 [Aldrovandia affinis]|uniref:ribonuclease H n=1 Tax=Aldrovandia affinis TaxID=143900 RepID=A0AAD7T653_9TELE|nr:hypothetical protein AAFF_G00007950 [Aldrovandia affinis]
MTNTTMVSSIHNINMNMPETLPEKVAAISDFPQPRTTKALQEFLGMVNFYHRFVPHAANLMRPMFGALKGAFQRLMRLSAQGDLTFLFVYLDDILVASECKADHLSHLRTLFERLSQHGLIVNPAKCQFGLPSIDFLGHHIKGPTRLSEPIVNPAKCQFGLLSIDFLGHHIKGVGHHKNDIA